MITVVGLGKIGLPLAVQFANKGNQVVGLDINPKVVEMVNEAIEPFPGERDLQKNLQQVVKMGNLRATQNFQEAIENSNYIVVVVPLYVDSNGNPDFRSIDNATSSIGKYISRGALISFETTLPVGTTRNRFSVILERESQMRAGEDFYVAFSPERVFTGRVFNDLRKYPKLVGGINEASSRIAYDFYSSVLDFEERADLSKANGVWLMKNCESAELTKLAETTYRDVNIALANQYALFAESNNLDIEEVIEAANSQPYSHIHQPGIAVGGHCIPVYPKMYLLNDPSAELVRISRTLNENMPEIMVGKLEKLHGNLENQAIEILGIAYRGDVKESAFSGTFALSEALKSRLARVKVHDPIYSDDEIRDLGFTPYHFGENVDAIILHTNHSAYKDLSHRDFPEIRTVLDGRGLFRNINWPGVKIHTLGKS